MSRHGLLALASGLLALASVLLALGCGAGGERSDLILATTTSTQDSGLLDVLVPRFEARHRYRVKTIAVGTGKALAMARRGDADVVLAHAPALERELLEAGFTRDRRLVMHNDFVLVGPSADPAGIAGGSDVAAAMQRVHAAGALFVSRGDDSGTHFRERALWQAAGLEPGGAAYLETGQGMGATLVIASEKRGHTLSDRGTFLAMRGRLELAALVVGDPLLLNPYSVMEVDPARHPGVNAVGARAFADFLLGEEAQAEIARFGVERFGEPLFFPDAGKSEADLAGGG